MNLLVLLSSALLVSMASAQLEGVCTQAAVNSGGHIMPHPTHCGLYIACLQDLSAVVMECQEGLLFDQVTKNCRYPNEASCYNQQCSGPNTMWQHNCCDRYIGCKENGKFYVGKCEYGQVFNAQSGQCVVDYPCENVHCPRLSRKVPTEIPVSCPRRAVQGDPCVYREFDEQGNDRGVRPCAEGSAFNATTCNCGTVNSACNKATRIALNNRNTGQCQPTMVYDFNSPRPVSYTLKTPNGQRQNNAYGISAFGYSSSNGEGVFHQYNQRPRLVFWSFTRNMLLSPFGIKISFKVDNPQEGYSFGLITNDWPGACSGTLDVKAVYRNRQWTLVINAVGYNTMTSQAVQAQETQVSVPDTNGYIFFSLMMSRSTKSLSGYVSSRGSNPVAWGPVNVGGELIDINNCALLVADGLEGRLNELTFVEACGDENQLKSQLM